MQTTVLDVGGRKKEEDAEKIQGSRGLWHRVEKETSTAWLTSEEKAQEYFLEELNPGWLFFFLILILSSRSMTVQFHIQLPLIYLDHWFSTGGCSASQGHLLMSRNILRELGSVMQIKTREELTLEQHGS